jgi:signal transduction histidine kinase
MLRRAMRIEAPTTAAEATLPGGTERSQQQAAFLHSVAHELSTPLTPLVGYLKILLSRKLGPLTDQQAKVIEAMSHSAEHLSLIIDNLVDLADLEAGQTELRIGYVQVGSLLKAGMEEARVAGRSKRLTVECLGCGDQILKGDEAKIHQALANLLDNAVRFSPHGGVILGELRDTGERYEISIYDQGSGMDVGQLDRLSRPFSHAAFAYPARRPGAGLGLPVARRIAEAHGGELRAESPPQNQPIAIHHFAGTRITLIFPKDRARTVAAAASEPQS